MTFPSGMYGPVSADVGYFEVDVETLGAWLQRVLTQSAGRPWRLRRMGFASGSEATRWLAPGTRVSRYALVPVEAWTLLLSNGPLGTDVGVLPTHVAADLGRRAIRALSIEEGEQRYPGRLLDVYGPDGEEPLLGVRTIAAINDGGQWTFEAFGPPYAFEDLSAYRRRRKSDRFTSDMLYEYLRALGVPIDIGPAWNRTLRLELEADDAA